MPLQTVVQTPEFVRKVRAAGMTSADVDALVEYVAANPGAGELIQGAGGTRKLRWRKQGTGKSGGVRAITFFGGRDIPVFLLTVYGKGQKASLTVGEKNIMRAALLALPAAYRAS